MRLVYLSHSIVSDWNHGNAHFQRGILGELRARGHEAVALEPADAWSHRNLLADQGPTAAARFRQDFPLLDVRTYTRPEDVEAALEGADAVVVHEWTDPALVAEIGRWRAGGAGFTLLFHDTHHRAVSAPDELAILDLDGYDGVLAFGEVLSETYRRLGWGRQVHTWHEAADTARFVPQPDVQPDGDLVWIGNWGDGERSDEIREFLIEPAQRLGLKATVHGVRYPEAARLALRSAGIRYVGWLRNAGVPEVFAAHRATLHIPRRYYAEQLPGIPTIRMFEALACGIPLVSAPWSDVEGLFRADSDYLRAESGEHMALQLQRILADRAWADSLARSGRETILARHTCAHRVDELLEILAGAGRTSAVAEEAAE